ncbi:MAG: MBL fold metallo-hydrolase RNA specificity domain-containing protein [Burkholderiales bacterium]
MRLSFHGANQAVTGSCHLLQCGAKHLLVDCGIYQGGRELDEQNAEPFGFEPAEIDYVLLTHAHLDHCGRLPLLVKRGFKGEIITTGATRELARIVLLDSAHVQEEEAQYRARKAARRHGSGNTPEPLYNTLDALQTLEYFGRSARYGVPMDITPGISATFLDAGHILGSASVLLHLEESGRKRSVAFSGDLGNMGNRLLRDPVPPVGADIVVMECTYGDRLHRSPEASVQELYETINDTFRRGGNVIIPTFALERAQELLFILRECVTQGQLPHHLPVFLDSPMAISTTEVFKRHPDCYDAPVAALFGSGHDPFALPGLHTTRETAESMAINRINGGAIIMAGSGMCTGGRVRHHLKHNLWREDCSVIFVGFAAHGTLARRIIDGASTVDIFGEPIAVRARIHTINGFSAHADRDQLLAWQRRVKPQQTYLVHGEPMAAQSFAMALAPSRVDIPVSGQEVTL